VIALVAVLVLLAAVLIVLAALGAFGGPQRLRTGVDPAEARRLANERAERLLVERYRAGEISLEEFEDDLTALLTRRDRLEGPGR
jgi:uncharacterized membrane protein